MYTFMQMTVFLIFLINKPAVCCTIWACRQGLKLIAVTNFVWQFSREKQTTTLRRSLEVDNFAQLLQTTKQNRLCVIDFIYLKQMPIQGTGVIFERNRENLLQTSHKISRNFSQIQNRNSSLMQKNVQEKFLTSNLNKTKILRFNSHKQFLAQNLFGRIKWDIESWNAPAKRKYFYLLVKR